MLKKIFPLFLLFLFISLTLVNLPLYAETVSLTSGDVLSGTVTSYTEDSITFVQAGEDDERVIPRDEIISISFKNVVAPQATKQASSVRSSSNKASQGSKPKSTLPLMRVYLKNGEVLEGYITNASKEELTLTRTTGNNYLKIPMSRIILVKSNMASPFLGDRNGIGYMTSRTSVLAEKINIGDAVDQLSFRMYSRGSYFNEFLFGLAQSRLATTEEKKTVSVLSFKYRFAKVIRRRTNYAMYLGGSVGFLQINDETPTIPLKESGVEFSTFTGVEFFFASFPNLSFSTELGVSYKRLTHYQSLLFSAGPFPSFAIHYYL